MVNIAGRSKGCATCRRRKVKCDESLPECQRCVNMGVRCPGPRTSAFFVYSVSSAPSVSASPSPIVGSEPPSPSQDLVLLTASHAREPVQTVPQIRLPGPQPSPATAFDQLFVSHFIESFFGSSRPPSMSGKPPRTWLDELPVFLASPAPCAVKHSIRATCMLSYATVSQNMLIRTEACRWYARALRDLRRVLAQTSPPFDESAVCAAVMLGHFETWGGTNPKAWIPHVQGAALLVAAAGPQACRAGFMHRIFQHLRLQACLTSMAENKLHAFAARDWMTIPFELHPKMFFDTLADVLFSVQRCLKVAEKLIWTIGETAAKLKARLETLILDAMSQLHTWWLRHPATAACVEQPSQCDAGHLPMLPYTDTPSASISSLYHAASLVIFRLHLLVSHSACSYNGRARHHAQCILSDSLFTDANTGHGPGPDRGSIIMAVQLKMASMWSPTRDLRESALAMMQRGGIQQSGFAGIAAESHAYFADVASYILVSHTRE